MSDRRDVLERVKQAAADLGLASLQPLIAACERRLADRSGLDVAVFGRFKAGKSSFLNHLTGRAVLPVGVVPLTAVITRLRYGPTERATVRFIENGSQTIPLADIGRYVGEDENPNNEKRVTAVEVELPALEPWRPLEFVDTPGLGSALTHNTGAALDWLPNVGAALVASSADAPLSERDLGLIEELRRHTPKVVLLLTKADLLSGSQRAEVRAFVSAQLRRKWPEELPVFFYSIQPAGEPLKQKIEQELLWPLIQQGSQAATEITQHKLHTLIGRTVDYLRVALAAATQAESARAELRTRLAEERRALADFREELQVLGHQWSASALDVYREHLRPDQKALQSRVTAELRGLFPTWRLRLPAFARAYGQWLHEFLRRELAGLSHTRHEVFREPLERARQHLTRARRAFQDRLAQHIKDSLGVAREPHQFTLEVPEPEKPPVRVSTEFMVPMDLLGYLVPMTLVRPWIERRLLRRARWEVEKNLSRLAADWQARVSAGIRQLNEQALQSAETELATLEQLSQQAPARSPELRQAIAELDAGRPEPQGQPAEPRTP